MTPLRYPGGKGKFTPKIIKILEVNDLLGGAYIEPYAGGAGIAVQLLLNDYVKEIYINDIHPGLFSFWDAILTKTDLFCQKIINVDVTMDTWYEQKHILETASGPSFDLAFATFFLNRTNYSGIIKGGVIGGKEQKGSYKLGARFVKDHLIKRIQKIAALKDRIYVYNQDAKDFIEQIKPKISKKSLVYFDPPYYVKGKGLYINHYTHKDHQAMKDFIAKQDFPWIVSYDNVPEIREIYADFDCYPYSLNYRANRNSRKGEEILFLGKNVKIPENLFD